MAHYLVTGGAGFIGSHLCEALLAANHTVNVLDNLSSGRLENLPTGARLMIGDIQDRALVNDLLSEVDGCFHLAAIASVPLCNEDWLAAHQVNLTGTLQIIEAARANTVPVVFASSAAVYGDSQELPLRETAHISPISIYGLNKLACEDYARIASQLFQLPCTALRLFNVYGPRQSPNSSYSGVITVFLNQLLADRSLTIYGKGDQTRDFIYVADIVRFFITAMQTSRPGLRVYNACSGHSTSIQAIADCLAQILQKHPELIYQPPKLGDIYHSLGNPELAKRELGIVAETSWEEGLKQLVASQTS